MRVYNLNEINNLSIGVEIMLVKISFVEEKSTMEREPRVKEKVICSIDENDEERIILRSKEKKLVDVYQEDRKVWRSKEIFNLRKVGPGVQYTFIRDNPTMWASHKDFIVFAKKIEKLKWIHL